MSTTDPSKSAEVASIVTWQAPAIKKSSQTDRLSSQRTVLHFVRHGKVENPGHLLYERLPDFHLSERGLRMAQATARYIAADPGMNQAAAVYSSPLDRTRETAGAILEALNPVRQARGQSVLALKTDDRLIEAGNEFRGTRIGFGQGALWRPKNLWRLRALWRPSWGETYRHIAGRLGDFAAQTVREHPGEHIIIVSHESPIFSYRHLIEKGHPEHNMLLRHTALASITSITYDSATGKPLSVAYVDPAADVE
ncbi:Broad specificity phosphatase PhoE [Bifidobacterium bohemicum]|uniref:Phosphoglycerate mutase n=1 Tax=Bifidobacterium bohemicum DSM 22767 TaxID=1437606 RepID=A0A086ZF19_9BIFI|nr:histidine phosphatase family protein [Bifidobacterium bohemicum]KFI45119.1 Phosphoglycerate mutase [Bifidobacterium bohemicum DSM 22767]SCB91070.1 Broad specificity phosphatase PhoE [Bifidobacterium bohemicum]